METDEKNQWETYSCLNDCTYIYFAIFGMCHIPYLDFGSTRRLKIITELIFLLLNLKKKLNYLQKIRKIIFCFM